jgi:hypothetical protein
MGIGYIIAHIFEYVKGKCGKNFSGCKERKDRCVSVDRQMSPCYIESGVVSILKVRRKQTNKTKGVRHV